MRTVAVKLETIIRDPEIQIRSVVRANAIAKYAESFDRLPPIVLFRTKEGLLLCDGFHRLAAAEQLGKDKINAQVIEGTRSEAIEHAIICNSKHGEPLTLEERDEAIRRLKAIHPGWSLRKIADHVGVSHIAVKRVLDVEQVRTATGPAVAVSPSHFREIAGAPRDCWKPLVDTVSREKLSVDDTASIVRALRAHEDSDSASTQPAALLSDLINNYLGTEQSPAEPEPSGVNLLPSTTSRALRDLAKLAKHGVDSLVNSTDFFTRGIWQKQLPGNIAFLQNLAQRLEHPFSDLPMRSVSEARSNGQGQADARRRQDSI